jgi:hypothetical protein
MLAFHFYFLYVRFKFYAPVGIVTQSEQVLIMKEVFSHMRTNKQTNTVYVCMAQLTGSFSLFSWKNIPNNKIYV